MWPRLAVHRHYCTVQSPPPPPPSLLLSPYSSLPGNNCPRAPPLNITQYSHLSNILLTNLGIILSTKHLLRPPAPGPAQFFIPEIWNRNCTTGQVSGRNLLACDKQASGLILINAVFEYVCKTGKINNRIKQPKQVKCHNWRRTEAGRPENSLNSSNSLLG